MPSTVNGPDVLVVADGASIHTRRLLRAIVERDVRVELASFETADISGVPEHGLGSMPPSADVRYLFGALALARVVRARRPRLMHAHYVSSYGVMSALASRLTGRRARLIQTAWGTDLLVTARRSRARSALATFALRTGDLATGDSADLERETRRRAPAVPFRRFVFGPPARLLASDEERAPIIVSARRLDPDMRVELIVRAFRHARRVAPGALAGWRLLVAGDGSDRDRVRDAAGGDNAVELAGRLEPDALHARLARARAQVSVPRTDATSAALLEGSALGLLPVVNDLQAAREWVDESIGEIVPRDPSVEELAAAIVRSAMREVPRERIRDRVREVTWEREVDGLVAAYRSLLPR